MTSRRQASNDAAYLEAFGLTICKYTESQRIICQDFLQLQQPMSFIVPVSSLRGRTDLRQSEELFWVISTAVVAGRSSALLAAQ